MGIRMKVMLVVILAVTIAGISGTLISRAIALDIVKDEIGEHLIGTSLAKTELVETTLRHFENTTETMAEQITRFKAETEGMPPALTADVTNQILAAFAASSPDFREAILLDSNGIVYASSDPEWLGIDLGDSAIFQKAHEGVYVGEMSQTENENGVFQLGSATTIQADPSISDVIVLVGGEESLFGVTTSTSDLGDTGEVYLVNADGLMITPSRFLDNAVLHQQVELSANNIGANDLYSGEHVDTELRVASSTNYLGTEVIGVYRALPDIGWTLVVEKSKSEAFASVSHLTQVMLWSLLAVLAFGILLAFFASRTISKPILRLRRGSEEIMRGNWDYVISTNARDEIGDLSRTFSCMTANLKKSQEELKDHSTNLEQKVEQRTVELTAANADLTREVTERQKAEEALRQSEEKYRTIIENVEDGYYEVDLAGNLTFFNDAAMRILGYAEDRLMGMNNRQYMSSGTARKVYQVYHEVHQTGNPARIFDFEVIRQGGDRRYCEVSVSLTRDAEGEPKGFRGVVRDITERQQAKEALQNARDELELRVEERTQELQNMNTALRDRIEEREVLLKEIHHRVKNNLQIISSLLNLQKDGIVDDESRVLFEESRNRVRSMALIHERLYQSGDLSQIDFIDYVGNLAGQLVRSFGNASGGVDLQVQGTGIFLDVDTAIPCGLIINELITNSLKYAFPDGQAGHEGNRYAPQIRVNMTDSSDSGFTLVVADNGIGLREDLDYWDTETLGFQLVTSLVAQLRATLEVDGTGGTTIRISIPRTEDSEYVAAIENCMDDTGQNCVADKTGSQAST